MGPLYASRMDRMDHGVRTSGCDPMEAIADRKKNKDFDVSYLANKKEELEMKMSGTK